MTEIHDAWLARQRARWLRPNAHLFIRPDAHRFMRLDWKRYMQPGFEPLHLSLLEGKANFNPNQPRVPKGNSDGGQWTDEDGGRGASEGGEDRGITDFSSSRIRYRFGGSLSEPSTSQLRRIMDANQRYQEALQNIHQTHPGWRPKTSSLSNPNSIEGMIGHAEARAQEAEHFRRGIGGNFGPPLDTLPPVGTGLSSSRPFDGPAWISAYRTLSSAPNLFGEETWPRDKGTVAVSEVNNIPIFGVNSESPTYTEKDRMAARQSVDTLIEKYPDLMATQNIGRKPNDALFHAEATILLRSAQANGGSLNNRILRVDVDRPMCGSCDLILPKLGIELGNPTVSFHNQGVVRTMRDGKWIP